MSDQPHIPSALGFGALDELDNVNWSTLEHAYGAAVVGNEIWGDVERSLVLIAQEPFAAISDGLYSSICHQGTVYQATAFALPFLVAVAAGEVPTPTRLHIAVLIGDIAVGASMITLSGSSRGSFGEGVDSLLQTTFQRCDPLLASMARMDSQLVPLIAAVRTLTREPTEARREDLLQLLEELV